MILTDQLLAEAAAEVDGAMLAGLPEPEECRPEFSRWFEQRMKRVLRRGRHPAVYRVMQRAAVFVLVLFLGFAAVMAVSPTVRASVFGWIREQYDSLMHYYFEDGAAPVEGPVTYCITDLPAQYTEVISDFDEEIGKYLGAYVDGEGNMMYFMYSLIPDNSNFYIIEEGYDVERVYVSNNTADFYLAKDPSDSNAIICCDSETNAVFCITAYMDKEELIALAESVGPPEEETTMYYISDLPTRYTELTSSYDEELGIFLGVYADDEGNNLLFTYYENTDDLDFFIEEEGFDVSTISINGNPADLYIAHNPEESNSIIWYNSDADTVFYISGLLDRDALVALAESVRSPAEEPTMYDISDLPLEYTEVTSFFNEELGEYTGVYCDDEEHYLYFMYSLRPEISNYYLGSAEDYMIEQVYIDGNNADFYQSKDRSESNGIIWFDAEANVVFFLSARMEKEELMSMAESVRPKRVHDGYRLTGLPEGYTETAKDETEGSVFTIYAGPQERILVFAYAFSSETAEFYVGATNYTVSQVSVSGCSADFYQANDPENDNCIIWCDSNEDTMFYISAYLDRDALIALAESVEPVG